MGLIPTNFDARIDLRVVWKIGCEKWVFRRPLDVGSYVRMRWSNDEQFRGLVIALSGFAFILRVTC